MTVSSPNLKSFCTLSTILIVKYKITTMSYKDYEQAKKWVLEAKQKGYAISVGLVADIGDTLEKLLADNIIPDIVTDQTSAHDPIIGDVPNGLTYDEAIELRQSDPEAHKQLAIKSMARHVGFMLKMKERGSIVFDYGNNLREMARQGGEEHAFDYQGFVPEFIRPLFCDGKGPFRWVALSGDPEDIYTTDQALIDAFPENTHLANWLSNAQKKVTFQGLPSRICWLGYGCVFIPYRTARPRGRHAGCSDRGNSQTSKEPSTVHAG